MSNTPTRQPLFYQPVFGNDNGYAHAGVVDVAAFSAPALNRHDVALDAASSLKKAK
ncbi:MAG: hypothetical protein KGQ41_06455 [Alphaproteobacteria bacterium]|nr:hypothetical protein [Alphaproteobacteria bacterium]